MLIAIVDNIAEERILLRTRLENILDQKNVKFHRYEYELCKPARQHFIDYLFQKGGF